MVPFVLITACLVNLPAAPGEARPGELAARMGEPAPVARLTFTDIRYLARTLNDFGDRKAFVLVFTKTSCPLAQHYLPALSRLEKVYRDRDVQFLALNVAPEDSVVAMAAQAVEYDVEFPFVKDFEGKWAPALGVERTPEVVVLDGRRRLCYRGRIDDQYRLGGARPEPTRHDLREALDEVLGGKPVSVAETPVDGCLINQPEVRAAGSPITFTEHVAPVLRKHCQECHRPEAPAPFALLTYKAAASRAATIAEVVAQERMPPWYPDGKKETLLLVPNYSFDWQMPYRFEPGKKRLPRGTRLECLAYYDNSAFNPFNPDPRATVREGLQTYQEMMNGFVFYTDEAEKLSLDVDPKTGQAREAVENSLRDPNERR